MAINHNNTIVQRKFIFHLLLLAAISLQATTLFANVRLPAVFSNGMVLQQNTEVIFWGWANPGEKITISVDWSTKEKSVTADAQGKWQTSIKTVKAGGPYTIRFKASNEIELKEVLLGEVWLCSGQSNMGFTLKASEGAKEEIAKADYPAIRYFSVKRQYGLQDFDDCPGSKWEKTSSANAGSFSAVAYYFATKIQKELNVPVGIIFTAWGGTPAEAWTPRPVLKNDTILSKYIDRWAVIQNNVGKDSILYRETLEQWKKDSTKSKKPAEPQTLYYFNRPWREPAVLFNGMIEPVIPFAIKGVLWYQGESNVAYADEYYHLFSEMIHSWRNNWKEKGHTKDIPFYFVQIAPNGYNDLDAAARLREAQQQVADKISNTAMAVTADVGNMGDIHPIKKREVGDRLARIALAKLYGNKKISFKAPVVKKAIQQNGTAVLTFDKPVFVDAGKTPQGFEIGYRVPGSDSIVFKPAQATLENNKLKLWSESVQLPVAVRYAWLLAGDGNLFDKDKLPVAPFRIMIND